MSWGQGTITNSAGPTITFNDPALTSSFPYYVVASIDGLDLDVDLVTHSVFGADLNIPLWSRTKPPLVSVRGIAVGETEGELWTAWHELESVFDVVSTGYAVNGIDIFVAEGGGRTRTASGGLREGPLQIEMAGPHAIRWQASVRYRRASDLAVT